MGAMTVGVTIVGGGIHGVHLAVRLLESATVNRPSLRIVEPNGLLGGFQTKCRQCGMTELRSPFVHHVARDPFSLRDFAREHGREAELRPTDVGSARPTRALFFDHATWVCDRHDLESLVVEARVTNLRVDTGGSVHIETTAGNWSTRWCLLAVGHGGSYTEPAWATELPECAPVTHVWDSAFDPEEIEETASVGIVGGGITAAQLASSLAQPGREITLFARSPFRINTLEAPTEWMHMASVLERLHELPPASRAREQLVADARHDGAIAPSVFCRLRRAIDNGAISLEQTEIVAATEAGGTVVVTGENGRARCLDHVLCATGFGSPYDGSLIKRLRDSTSLATGYRGAPVLADETLQWKDEDGMPTRVAVSGACAQGVLGPFARNIIGARRSGERIVAAIGQDLEATTLENSRLET